MITSPDNQKLKQIRKLHGRRERSKLGLFVAEGEDLIAAAGEHGWEPEFVLHAGADVEPALLDAVSDLGSGTRVIGVYRQRWSEPGGDVSVYLHGVRDPGNIGTILRSAHAFADGPVILGAHCADPWSPKAVRASMGSIFARPPARAAFGDLPGTTIAYVADAPEAEPVDGPVVLCIGGEREGLGELAEQADVQAGIPMQPGAPNSLNAAMAATVALYDRFRMARHG
ncbi:MAG: TrmH family RNA methyltransferase [Thermoleophilaceae bacterium]|jgi:RNA methyltransferase, TrmH family